MSNIKWQEILGKINSDPDLKRKNIIEEIRNRLVEVLSQDKYKKWKDKKFNINHLFQVECDESIGEYTLLHISTYFGLKDVVNALLAKGAEVNAKDGDGMIPLHYAAERGYSDIVNALLAKGAEVNAKDGDGQTPLYYAAERGHIGVENALLDKGAKFLCLDEDLRSLKEAEEKRQRHLKSIMIISVTAGCLTAASEIGLAVLLITRGDLPVEPIPMVLIAVAIAVVALTVGCIVYQAFKKPSTKVDETQTLSAGDKKALGSVYGVYKLNVML